MRHFHALSFVGVLLVAAVASTAAAQTYDDGLVHTIDNDAASPVIAADGPGSAPTTVRVIAPADLGHLTALQHSIAEVHGGTISHVNSRDEGLVEVFGGEMSFVNAYDHARANIYGGTLDWATANGTWPSPTMPTDPPSLLTIYGGAISTVLANDGGQVAVRGGDIGQIDLHFGTVHVYGGTIGIYGLPPDTAAYVYGTDLALTYQAGPQYLLTGTLQDGTPLNETLVLVDPSVVHLVEVPEPSTLLLATLGIALVAATRRRVR